MMYRVIVDQQKLRRHAPATCTWTFPKLGTRSPIPQAAAGYCPQTEERD
jgi:hypothetical protein